jgi:uncharacterized membrane protein YjfL (UPF0719 family)
MDPLLGRILATAGWGVGITLGILVLTWAFDRIHPIDFKTEIERGNVAAAIYMAAYIIVIGAALIAMAIT